MTYALGKASLQRLAGVHPDLVAVVQRAIEITPQDFTVMEGVRSVEAEKTNVAKGVSRTMNSKHLIQPDGFGHAVDLVPWINGAADWDWDGCYAIAAAMRAAADGLAVKMRWGGVWDRSMAVFAPTPNPTADAMKAEHLAYVARFEAANPGRHALCDGPHFELD